MMMFLEIKSHKSIQTLWCDIFRLWSGALSKKTSHEVQETVCGSPQSNYGKA